MACLPNNLSNMLCRVACSPGLVTSQRPQHYCSICNVTATSAVHLKTHFMGSKHQRRVSVLQSGHPQPRPQHYCEASYLKH